MRNKSLFLTPSIFDSFFFFFFFEDEGIGRKRLNGLRRTALFSAYNLNSLFLVSRT